MTSTASTTAESTQVAETTEAQAAETEAQAQAAGSTTEDEREDAALTPSAARALRSEAARARVRLKEAEDQLAKARQAEMTEQEKLAEQTTTLRAELDQAHAETRDLRVQLAAVKLGIVDPEAAAKLLDWDTVTDPTDLKQVSRALKALLQDKPYLAGTNQSIDAGAGRSTTHADGHVDMNDRLRAAAGRTR